ncbi:MAG: sigma-54-dependent Fis family transcriptional regulator, partial [Deltaproteobacteria bacterium]
MPVQTNPPKPRILFVEDDERLRESLTVHLEDITDVVAVANGREALERFETEFFDLVLTDVRMPEMDGMTLLKEIKARDPSCPVIILTAFGSVESAVEMMKAGAGDYIVKGQASMIEEIQEKVGRHLEISALRSENEYLRQEIEAKYDFNKIIGKSKEIVKTLSLAGEVAKTDTTVLITGESGTGKELLARAIHYNSPRRARRFVAVNCAAIPEHLLESELFGHERGAFTGAVQRKPGKFEIAHQGTFFLDEIGEMPMPLQVKLLRVLQDQEFERVGGVEPIRTDVRIIAATNRDLAKRVQEGSFRQDLYYRINVFPVHLPPLRERKEDILLLAQHFLERFAREMGKKLPKISEGAQQMLREHPWPGNIRELENAIERAIILAQGDTILPEHLPFEPPVKRRQVAPPPDAEIPFQLPEGGVNLEALERSLVLQALERCRYNKSQAARL